MNKREAAICELYTRVCFLTGDDRKYVYELAEKVMGRPVYTHELYTNEVREAVKPLFVNMHLELEEE